MAFGPLLGSLFMGEAGSVASEGMSLLSGIGEGIESLFGHHHHPQDTSLAHFSDGLSSSVAYSPGAAVGMLGAFDSGSVQQELGAAPGLESVAGHHTYSTTAKLGLGDEGESSDPNGIDIY